MNTFKDIRKKWSELDRLIFYFASGKSYCVYVRDVEDVLDANGGMLILYHSGRTFYIRLDSVEVIDFIPKTDQEES